MQKTRATRIARVPAGDFKQRCLQLMDEVRQRRIPIIVTKRGVPVAKLVPLDEADAAADDSFGSLHGSVTYHGDIVEPDLDVWSDDG